MARTTTCAKPSTRSYPLRSRPSSRSSSGLGGVALEAAAAGSPVATAADRAPATTRSCPSLSLPRNVIFSVPSAPACTRATGTSTSTRARHMVLWRLQHRQCQRQWRSTTGVAIVATCFVSAGTSRATPTMAYTGHAQGLPSTARRCTSASPPPTPKLVAHCTPPLSYTATRCNLRPAGSFGSCNLLHRPSTRSVLRLAQAPPPQAANGSGVPTPTGRATARLGLPTGAAVVDRWWCRLRVSPSRAHPQSPRPPQRPHLRPHPRPCPHLRPRLCPRQCPRLPQCLSKTSASVSLPLTCSVLCFRYWWAWPPWEAALAMLAATAAVVAALLCLKLLPRRRRLLLHQWRAITR